MQRDIKWPLYEVRGYLKIETQGTLKILHTVFNSYLLDDTSLEGSYSVRRIRLAGLGKNIEYKLYPLNKQFTKLSQVIANKSKVFIDSDANIFKWRKEKMYPIKLCRVLHSNQIYNGKYHLYVKDVNYPIISDSPANYVSLVDMGTSFQLFDVHDARPEKPRTRVKI